MNTKHTPGPWEVHQGLDYIVVMRGDETTEQGIRVDNIEDACLFAAAPDLLEALEELLIDSAAHINVPISECVAGPLGKARAAIAKARKGEA